MTKIKSHRHQIELRDKLLIYMDQGLGLSAKQIFGLTIDTLGFIISLEKDLDKRIKLLEDITDVLRRSLTKPIVVTEEKEKEDE